MIFGQNLGKQTERAKQEILRYIWDQKLREGDKIPAQAALSRDLGMGCATLDRAVKAELLLSRLREEKSRPPVQWLLPVETNA